MNAGKKIARLCLLIVWLGGTALHSHAQQILRLGVLELHPRAYLDPSLDVVESELGKLPPKHKISMETMNFRELEEAVASRSVDYLITNPSHYHYLRDRYGLSSPIATLSNSYQGQLVHATGGVIFTRADRQDITTLRDLKGKSIAYVDQLSLGGYQSQVYELLEHNLDINDARELQRLGLPHQNIVQRVLDGNADVGFVSTGVLEMMIRRKQISEDRFKIIHTQELPHYPYRVSTRLYPEWPLAATPHADPEITKFLAGYLLALPTQHPMLKALDIGGLFVPGNYQGTEQVARELKLPPYNKPPEVPWSAFFQNNAPEFIGAGFLVASLALFAVWLARYNHRLRLQAQRTDALLSLPAITGDEEEFLQNSLNYAEKLTGSVISFVHFVDESDQDVEFFAWSKSTKEKYCEADHERHYPVDEAGIWADAIRLRKPVVINQYSKAPNRHGLPEGHARLHRIISLPVVSDGKVVMIVGVGNKPQPYSSHDVETLQLLANEMWGIAQSRRNQNAIAESESRLRGLVDSLNAGVVVHAPDTAIVLSNPRAAELLGLVKSDMTGKLVSDDAWHFLESDGTPMALERFPVNQILASNKSLTDITLGIVRPNSDETTWVLVNGAPIYKQNGDLAEIIISFVDITSLRKTEAELLRTAAVFANTAEGAVITDLEGNIVDINTAYSRITGYTRDDVIGENPRLLQSGRHDYAFYQNMWRSLKEIGSWAGEIWNRRKDGSVYPELLTINVLTDQGGEQVGYVGVFSDITQLKQSEERLAHIAHHDPLTNLPNRLLLNDRLSQGLKNAVRGNSMLAVIFLDIDHFKAINDSLGHSFGDKLLQEIAKRLAGAIRENDTVARISGDEFVIMLEDIHQFNDVVITAQKIQSVFSSQFMIDGEAIRITASMGISLYPENGNTATTLISNADAALYQAKDEGRNAYRFFSEELSQQAFEQIFLRNALHAALEAEQFRLVYQPQINIFHNDCCGVECLLRWDHPDQGAISPSQFIPIAEHTGLIRNITEWVLTTACHQAQSWLESGINFGALAVNISANQIHDDQFINFLRQTLAETRLPPQRLELEVTESSLLRQADMTIARLTEIRNLGIAIAVDDFGTGYSNLSYLKRLPLTRVKIDQSFIRDIPGDRSDAALSEAIIAMSSAMDLGVIAEGVETEEQVNFLKEKGCLCAQGFYFSKPLEHAEIPQFLSDMGQPRC